MHELYELKEMLMDELKQYSKKGELTSSTLEVVDKLTHSIKNICKIIEAYEMEEEYSSRGSYEGGGSYRGGGNYAYARGGNQGGGGGNRRYSYENDNMSYARGRGRNARRDSMGRYSREGGYSMDSNEMVENLREMMQEAPNEQIKMEIQKLVQKMEQQM